MRLDLHPKAIGKIRRGHPWIYREALREIPKNVATGATVDVYGDEKFVARGLYDAQNPIAVRVYAREPDQVVDVDYFGRLARHAIQLRIKLFADQKTTAYRLINGEGDRLPGVVVDRYGQFAVLRFDGEAIASHCEALTETLKSLLQPLGIQSLLLRNPKRKLPPLCDTLFGSPPSGPVEVTEHGMRMMVDLLHGQKTGAFLDQRENRARVRRWTQPGYQVLNLFSYSGGFSAAAALSGAAQVTSVDSAYEVHATAQENFRRNGLDPRKHHFVTADAIEFVGGRAAQREKYDLVISDPPSFARNERNVDRALAGYSKLHTSCAKVVKPGGMLLAASCSSHVPLEAFLQTLDDRTLGSSFVLAGSYGLPADHPTLPCFPEGRYLKLAVLYRAG